jgi:hypothetical protein
MSKKELVVTEIDDVGLLRQVYDRFPEIRRGLSWDDFLVNFYERQYKEDYRILVGFLDGVLVRVESASHHFQVADIECGTLEFRNTSLLALWTQIKK